MYNVYIVLVTWTKVLFVLSKLIFYLLFFGRKLDTTENLMMKYFYLHITNKICNIICIPESFNTNISHQIFANKITFVNSQCENTNSKGDFILNPIRAGGGHI